MSFYENVFIVRQDLSSQQVDALTDHYTRLITDHGGKVVDQEYWGIRQLAYPIKKNMRGHYVMLKIQASPAALNELNRQMGLNEDVLRTLTIKVDALEKGPSIMMRAGKDSGKEGRSEEGDTEIAEKGN